MENDDEVGLVDDEVHIGNDDSQYEENNIESASEDIATEEEIIPLRQDQVEPATRQRRKRSNLDNYVTNMKVKKKNSCTT